MNRICRRLLISGAIAICALVSVQFVTWWLLASNKLMNATAITVRGITDEELIVNWDCLKAIPTESAEILVEELAQAARVWQEQHVPADYFSVDGVTGDGRQIRHYAKGKRFCVESMMSSPIAGEVRFSLYRAPLAAEGYRVRYLWVLGRWVELSSRNPVWRS